MTSQELSEIVAREERFERWFGFLLVSVPLLFSLYFLGYFFLGYIEGSDILILVWFALVVTLLCAAFAWLCIRSIQSKYKKFMIITFGPNQIAETDLINQIMDSLDYRKVKNDRGIFKFISQGMQTDNIVYIASHSNEIYVNLQTESFVSWGQRSLKKRFIKKCETVAKEMQLEIRVEEKS